MIRGIGATVLVVAFLSCDAATKESAVLTADRAAKPSAERTSPAVVKVVVASRGGINRGTGFIADPNGVVLTPLHILNGARAILVQLPRSNSYMRASVLATDAQHDLAVLKIAASGLPAVRLAPSDQIWIGSRVAALGAGSEEPTSTGTVDGLQFEGAYSFRADEPVPPGFSGRPVVDEEGAIVGMAVSRVVEGEGVSVIVPNTYVREVLDRATLEPAGELASARANPRGRDAVEPLKQPVELASTSTGRREEAGDTNAAGRLPERLPEPDGEAATASRTEVPAGLPEPLPPTARTPPIASPASTTPGAPAPPGPPPATAVEPRQPDVATPQSGPEPSTATAQSPPEPALATRRRETDEMAMARAEPGRAVAPSRSQAAPETARGARGRSGEAARERPTPELSSEAAVDLTGQWDLMNTIERTSYPPYEGMRLGFRLNLRHDGDTVSGYGEKWQEDGRTLPASARSPIRVLGVIRNGVLQASFTEHGARRTVTGSFRWNVLFDGRVLQGRFNSPSAASRGRSTAVKID